MLKSVVLCLVICLGVVHCYPSYNPIYGYHQVPRRSVMFGGYYSNPQIGAENGYIPKGSMSAVVSGDTVATNSFSGLGTAVDPQWVQTPNAQVPLHEPEPAQSEKEIRPDSIENETSFEDVTPKPVVTVAETHPEAAVEPEVNEEEDVSVSSTEIVVTSTKKPKTAKRLATKKRKPQKEEEEDVVPQANDEDDESGLGSGWPFGAGGRGGPSYTAFFPIMIGGGGSPSSRRRSGNVAADDSGADGFFPGSATAIANSFSTGKGGVATSHATSFGDPYLAQRFLKSFGRKGNSHRGVDKDVDEE